MAGRASDEVRDKQADGYRQAIFKHLTSWVEVLTGVQAEAGKVDSASVAWTLQRVVEKIKRLTPNPAEDVIGADGVLMLESAAHLMLRASQYSGLDLPAEERCARAALTTLDEAYRDMKSWQRFSSFGRQHPELRIE